MGKSFDIKIYDRDGVYLNTWNEAVSDVSFNNEINTSGGQMKITLARDAGDYGEGSDVDFGLRVVIICIDAEAPGGTTVFQGYITSYTPIYKDNNVVVTVLGYGAEFSDMMLETSGTELVNLYVEDDPWVSGGSTYPFGVEDYTGSGYERVAWQFRPTTTGVASGFETIWGLNSGGGGGGDYTKVLYELWSGTILSPTAKLAEGSYDFTFACDIVQLSIYLSFYQGNHTSMRFLFDTSATITAGQDYHIIAKPYLTTTVVQGAGFLCWNASGNSDTNAKYGTYNSQNGWTVNDEDPRISIYQGEPVTTVAYNSFDPSDIIRNAIDSYNTNGGKVTYDLSTIEDTGTTVSYTFTTNTILEVIKKSLELSPKNWYWFLDYGTNRINFKEISNSPDHIFTLEKDLIDAKFEKRIDDIVNTVFFTGGDTGSGVNLYKKYEDTASVAQYGIKALKYNDSRVTVEATAETISNSILESKSQPELRVTLEVLDSNNDKGLGYDIESIKVGDLAAVRNVTQQVGLSTWDVARWDESYWDYNIYNLSSLQMQVQKIKYNNGETVIIYASTMAVDVNKRIEDINRNLEALQSQDNPDAPT